MPSLTITIEDSSPLISYSSGWRAGVSSDSLANSYSQSSFTVTSAISSSASFTFNGTSVEIFGAKRGNHGLYQVKLDDTLYPPVSGKATDPGQFQEPLFSNTTLNQGLHHLALINYENAFLDVDFITWQTQIGTDQEKLFVNIFQDTDPSFRYSPSEASWITNPENLGSFLGGTGQVILGRSSNDLDLMHNNILGEGVSLYGPVGPKSSSFGVQLDDGPISNFTSTKQFYTPQMLLYHASSLGPGPHQLKLLYQPTTPNQVFVIDYAAVYTTSPPTLDPTPLESHGSSGLTSLTVGMIAGMGASVVLLLAFLAYFLYQRRRWVQGKNIQSDSGVELYAPQSVSQYFEALPRPFIPNYVSEFHNDDPRLRSKPHLHQNPSQQSSISSSIPLLESNSSGLNSSSSRTTPTLFTSSDSHAESSAIPHTFSVSVDNEGLPPDYSQTMRVINK